MFELVTLGIGQLNNGQGGQPSGWPAKAVANWPFELVTLQK
jgi:hypothetical protein